MIKKKPLKRAKDWTGHNFGECFGNSPALLYLHDFLVKKEAVKMWKHIDIERWKRTK